MIILVAFDRMEAVCNARSSTCMGQVRTRERRSFPEGRVAASVEWRVLKKKGHIICTDAVADAAEESVWQLGFASLIPLSEWVSGDRKSGNKNCPCGISGCRGVK